jgi:RNA polymerase sigma factor (sigma-70 family)
MKLSDTKKDEIESILPLVMHMIRKFGFDNLGEDFIHNILLQVIEKSFKYKEEKSAFATYLANCTRYACLDWWNKHKKTPMHNTLNLKNDNLSQDFEFNIEKVDLFEKIISSVMMLSPLQRSIIELRFWENKSIRDICQKFNKAISKSVIEKEYKSALNILRVELAELEFI